MYKFSVKPSAIEQLHRKLSSDTNKSNISRVRVLFPKIEFCCIVLDGTPCMCVMFDPITESLNQNCSGLVGESTRR
jgi:hypothetical protein